MASPLARVNVRADAWDLIWSFVHRTLLVNAVLALAGSPLMLALATVSDPWHYPVFFAVLALPLGPAATAAFGYLAYDDPRPPLRVLQRVLARTWRRALLTSASSLALVGVLITDIRVLGTAMPGALLIPMLALLSVLVVASTLTILVLLATTDDLSYAAVLRAAVYATARRWPLAVLSLLVLAVAAVIVSQVPLAGLATAPACALWVVLTNSKLQLASCVEPAWPLGEFCWSFPVRRTPQTTPRQAAAISWRPLRRRGRRCG
ncbi:hypothetical protein [Kribbella shirazensis]|uniref:Putative membrane protein YesL n=1 Tax=Kribbella shirazensis TaxID=1105143 RepID=A0A7X5VI43_9ACTN|nr:hypothetical protein [Kribbella shirazensis]NIK61659.1 putative membrane protein YesL [Kribbella shirazensis]